MPNCTCEVCGKQYHLKPRLAAKNHYCSCECRHLADKEKMSGQGNPMYGKRGSQHHAWMTDTRVSIYGYMLRRVLDHPFRNCDDFVFEHRLVAEQYLLTDENSIEVDGKRYLKKEYAVHHIDENKLNNIPSNLAVMTKSQHMSLHQQLRHKLASINPVKSVEPKS